MSLFGLLVPVLASAQFPLYTADDFTLLGGGTYAYDSLSGEYSRPAQYEGQIAFGRSFEETYVGFGVFDIRDVILASDVGIDPAEVGGYDVFNYTLDAGALNIPEIQFSNPLFRDVPLQVRLSSAPVSALLDGTGDPEAMFEALIGGEILSDYLFELSALEDGNVAYGHFVSLGQKFTDLVNNGFRGPVVISFQVPYDPGFPTFSAEVGVIASNPDSIMISAGMELVPITPIPEPATYGIGAIVMLGLVAACRSRRLRRAPLAATAPTG